MKHKKAGRILGRVMRYLITGILAGLVCLNLYIAAVRQFGGNEYPTVCGYYAAVVVSGSMSDAIEVNDMVITHAKKDYAVGDVISFRSGSSLVTHRIVEKTDQGYRTKGDANNTPDPEIVKEEQIVGAVTAVIPAVGSALQFFSTPAGMAALFLLAAVILVWPLVFCHSDEVKKREK